jgi:hypothetical protein
LLPDRPRRFGAVVTALARCGCATRIGAEAR